LGWGSPPLFDRHRRSCHGCERVPFVSTAKARLPTVTHMRGIEMTRPKLGLQVLSLCAMLASALALPGAAQAEENAYWEVNGAKVLGIPSVEVETDVAGALLTELGGKQVHLKCQKVATIWLVTHLASQGKVLGMLAFDECKFFELVTPGGTTKELGACTPSSRSISGLIETNLISGLIRLHEGKARVEVLPGEGGKPFATIYLGEECAFGENITVGGKFWINDSSFETNTVEHLVSELKSLTALTINGGAKTATIDGSAWMRMDDSSEGLTFSAHPG
jgi:hypothetical protein